MDRVLEDGARHGYTKEKYATKLHDIIQEERSILKTGERILNNAGRK